MSWAEAFAVVIFFVVVGQILERLIEAVKEIWVARLISRTKFVRICGLQKRLEGESKKYRKPPSEKST